MNAATWLGWDGHRLRWSIEPSDRTCSLQIDGVVFQRFTTAASSPNEFAIDFPFSPSGNSAMNFSVARGDGEMVSRSWRVVLGKKSDVGCDESQTPTSMSPLYPESSSRAENWDRDVAIIVPIYNSPQLVARCIDAVLRWSPSSARLILIDDASTDPAIATLLDTKANSRVIVRRNASNRGYTHSVNVGIDLAGDADVILLNSDTQVGPRWLQSLRHAAYSDVRIATATAVSDNAGAFSVPELEQYCPIPAAWNLVAAQRAILQRGGLRYPALPTGNGFCMYIKRRVIERIGAMDEQAFPQGYGEENDFCQRAENAGFSHVIAGNVLVRHERSASFGHERRAALGLQGMAVLRERYPAYESNVGATLYSFERRALDYRIRRTYARSGTFHPRPRALFFGNSKLSNDTYEFVCRPHESDAPIGDWLVARGIEAVVSTNRIDADLSHWTSRLEIPVVTDVAQLGDVLATGPVA